jgi:pyruvate kinase
LCVVVVETRDGPSNALFSPVLVSHPDCAIVFAVSVYPELPSAGSYGYTVSEENMFDYDRPMVEKATDDFDLVLRNACRAALKKGLVSDPDDLLVVTAGVPFGTPGAANIIRIVPAAGPSCWDGSCRVD